MPFARRNVKTVKKQKLSCDDNLSLFSSFYISCSSDAWSNVNSLFFFFLVIISDLLSLNTEQNVI